MSKTPGPVTFADARRMSTGQLNKLSKEQLCIALKDAINVHNDDQPVTSVPHRGETPITGHLTSRVN